MRTTLLLITVALAATALAIAPTATAIGTPGGACNGTVDTNCTCTSNGSGCIKGEKCGLFVANTCQVG